MLLAIDRVVAALLGTYKAYLPGALTTLYAEFADGVTLPAPESWRPYRALVLRPKGGQVHLDAWVASGEFPVAARDASTWHGTAAANVTLQLDARIRLVHVNRDNLGRGSMEVRSYRYAEAMVRVLRDHPELGDAASAIVWAHPVSFAIAPGEFEGDQKEKSRFDAVTLTLQILMRESAASEGTAGVGAALWTGLDYKD